MQCDKFSVFNYISKRVFKSRQLVQLVFKSIYSCYFITEDFSRGKIVSLQQPLRRTNARFFIATDQKDKSYEDMK